MKPTNTRHESHHEHPAVGTTGRLAGEKEMHNVTTFSPESAARRRDGNDCRPVLTYEVDLRLREQIALLLKEVWTIEKGRRRGGHWSMSTSPTGEWFASRGGSVTDPDRTRVDIDNPVFRTIDRQVRAHRDMGGRVILGTDGAVCAACCDILVTWPEVPTRGLRPVQPWAARERRRSAS